MTLSLAPGPGDADPRAVRPSELSFRHRSALVALVGTAVGAVATLPLAPLSPWEVAAGLVLAVGGSALRLWAIRYMGKSARVHHAGASALRKSGPYARVRNPLYLANGAVTAGLAVIAAGAVGGLAAALGLTIIYALAVRHEERCLAADLGSEYEAFAATVPRWLPRLGRAQQDPGEPVAWREVARREFRLVLSVPLALVAVLLVRTGGVPLLAALARAAERLPGASAWHLVLLAGAAGALANAVSTERKLRRKAALHAALAAGAPAPTANAG